MNTVSRGTATLPTWPVHSSEVSPNEVSGAAASAPRALPLLHLCSRSNRMQPLFHFTADGTVILAMEHNNHKKLLAVSTSKNEIYVTSTCDVPLEDACAATEGQPTWEPAEATVLIDHLCCPCTYLAWGPWQRGGAYLACVCRGKQVRLYRLSHDHWSLDEVVPVQGCNLVAFSFHFTMACVTAKGNLLIFEQTTGNEGSKWSKCSTRSLEGDNSNMTRSLSSRGHNVRGLTCVAWDETGNFLSVGDDEGIFRVFHVLNMGRDIGEMAYMSDRLSERGKGLRQVLWAPGAGRSFLVVAVVTFYGVALLLFERPRMEERKSGGSHTPTGVSLVLITQTTAEMDEVTELTWNTSGTRFVTAHVDGKVCVWDLCVSSRKQKTSFNGTEDSVSGGGSSSGGAEHVGASRPSDVGRLTASVRNVCVRHPYYSAV